MRACRHEDVPRGGIVGGLIGAMEGPAIGQMRGGQIGGISIELLHSGCMSPSTHWHVQDASARAPISTTLQRLAPSNRRFIAATSRSLAPSVSHQCPKPFHHPDLFRIDFCSLYVLMNPWMAKPY
jgi:hypothetical protein